MIRILKGAAVGLTAALLLAGCTTTQEKVSAPEIDRAIASDATASEIKKHSEYVQHIKSVKKKKKRVTLKKVKVDLDNFCFKDDHSIHYRAEERCR
ncbi:MAG: hypothetical protein KAQ94_01200 [Arcobacteraceae bacterium]|nr:hypothetical protein [Arcobacteraceae bacterium]